MFFSNTTLPLLHPFQIMLPHDLFAAKPLLISAVPQQTSVPQNKRRSNTNTMLQLINESTLVNTRLHIPTRVPSPRVITTPTTAILHSLAPSAAWWIAGESGSGWTRGSWGCSVGQPGFPGVGNPFSPATLPAADPGSAAPAAYLHHKPLQVRNGASLLSAQQKESFSDHLPAAGFSGMLRGIFGIVQNNLSEV